MKKSNIIKALSKILILIIVVLTCTNSFIAIDKSRIKGPTLEQATAEYPQGNILTNLSKEAKRISEDEWEITLKFTPTKEMITATSYEVVLAIDTTNSLGPEGLNELKKAGKEVLSRLYKLSHKTNTDISLALIGFGGLTTDTNHVIPLTNLKFQNQDWLNSATSKIDAISMTSGTGTNYEEALSQANNLFNDSNKRQVCIFLADGEPNRSNQLGEKWNSELASQHAIEQANLIKNSGKVLYAIHYNDDNVVAANLLKECASDPDVSYYFDATNYVGLLDVFVKIINKLVVGKFEDYMGPNFELIDNHDLVTIEPGYGDGLLSKDSIKWTPSKGESIQATEHTLTYRVKADPTLQAGNYNGSKTNGVTRFIYSVSEDSTAQQFFTSPTADFTKASAKIEVTGLPDTVNQGDKPILTSPDLIYTGYSGKDRFEFKAPTYIIGNLTYMPTISYNAVASINGQVKNGLDITKITDSNYEITNKDLGSGVYTINVNYTPIINHIVDFITFGGSPIPENQIVPNNANATNPKQLPIKPGYIFEGWYTSDDLGTTLSKKPYNFDTAVTKDITLYAKWTAIDYTAQFDIMGGNEGTKPADQTNLKYGELVILPTPPTKNGYKFEGWYTSDDSGITLSTNPYDFNTKITGNITLYAKWTKENIVVTPEPSIPFPPTGDTSLIQVYSIMTVVSFGLITIFRKKRQNLN